MNEVIVYLIDYKSYGNGFYDNVIIDFLKNEHFKTYLDITREEVTLGSLLEIRNLRSEKRLVRGAYYALNVNLLSELKRERIDDSLVFAGRYHFNSYNRDNRFTSSFSSGSYQLFLPHSPLPVDRTFVSDDKLNLSPDVFGLDGNEEYDMKVVINDVGQANWNEIHVGNQVKIVYDIGAPIRAKKGEINKYINDYYSKYNNSNPLLIISHWDLDHYHCLLQMDDNQLRLFSGVICVNKVKSLIAEKTLWKIIGVMGRKRVTCISNPPRSYKPFPYPNLFGRIGCLSIYICERSRNINHSGIIMSVDGCCCRVICTGDSTLSQACTVLNISNKKEIIEHILVVPHHGGYYSNSNYANYMVPFGICGKEAIISVGLNDYGHPDYRTMNLLKSEFRKISRTDFDGVIMRPF